MDTRNSTDLGLQLKPSATFCTFGTERFTKLERLGKGDNRNVHLCKSNLGLNVVIKEINLQTTNSYHNKMSVDDYKNECMKDIRDAEREAKFNDMIHGKGEFKVVREPLKFENESGELHTYFVPSKIYIAMKRLPLSLDKLFNLASFKQKFLHTPKDKLTLFRKIVLATQKLHDHYHAVHGDFKDANICIDVGTEDIDIQFCDFGLTRSYFGKEDPRTEKTSGFCFYGTSHLPKELDTKPIEAHPSQDVYSLGFLLQQEEFSTLPIGMDTIRIKMLALSKSMRKENPEERPTLDDIIVEIDNILSLISSNEQKQISTKQTASAAPLTTTTSAPVTVTDKQQIDTLFNQKSRPPKNSPVHKISLREKNVYSLFETTDRGFTCKLSF